MTGNPPIPPLSVANAAASWPGTGICRISPTLPRAYGRRVTVSIIIAPMDTISTETAADDGFTPYTIVEGNPASGFVLICDHAENRIPSRYGTLGLGPDALRATSRWDPGAGAVTHALARRLGAPAVLSQFSRLLIDPNRGRDDPTLIMRYRTGQLFPETVRIDERERANEGRALLPAL